MSRPEQLRRRRKGQLVVGRRATVGAVALALVVGLGVLGWREASDPRFIAQIDGVRGCDHTAVADVVSAAGLAPGQNAWLIDRRALAKRVEALPWVARVAIHVAWPNRVSIQVTERRPAALVALGVSAREQAGPRYALIDEGQRVLELESRVPGALPVLVIVPPPAGATPGSDLSRPEASLALDAYRRLSALGLQISEVAIAPSTGISATADRNLRVLFGEDEDLAKKAALFQAIVAKISTPSRVAYVDVRSIRAPTVLYR